MPKQGSGNTNDGNMARKFFEFATVSADITGLDRELIENFRVILQALSSKFDIDAGKLGTFATATKHRLRDLYPCTSSQSTARRWCDTPLFLSEP